jgi:probable rRNA maturation factor
MPRTNAQQGFSAVQLDLDVEDEIPATWDEPLMQRLVSSIVASELPPSQYALALHLVGDETIRALNREHRSIDRPTDVLSFPLQEPGADTFVVPPGAPVHLGDVVISYPRALAQAEEFGHSAERELAYLVAHGVLHVLGYDHEEEDERRAMREREEGALAPLGLTR